MPRTKKPRPTSKHLELAKDFVIEAMHCGSEPRRISIIRALAQAFANAEERGLKKATDVVITSFKTLAIKTGENLDLAQSKIEESLKFLEPKTEK